MTKEKEIINNPPSLSKLMTKGDKLLLNLPRLAEITQQTQLLHNPNSYRVSSRTTTLLPQQIFGAVHETGKAVDYIEVTPEGVGTFTTSELDITFLQNIPLTKTDLPEMVHFGVFQKKINLVGSPGTNVVIATAVRDLMKGRLTNNDMDGVKSWFGDRGYIMKGGTPITMFPVSTGNKVESYALVFDPDQI
jgi:hypothetical protein